ncbi:MAG: hypothetical protein Q8K52_03775 [Thiobacillus sp.]|nr:hypothetical protein [Thiobacillus sp.]
MSTAIIVPKCWSRLALQITAIAKSGEGEGCLIASNQALSHKRYA